MPEFNDGPWRPLVDVRSVGHRLYEARTSHGKYSAVGFTVDESVANLRQKLPAHVEPVVQIIPLWQPEPMRLGHPYQ